MTDYWRAIDKGPYIKQGSHRKGSNNQKLFSMICMHQMQSFSRNLLLSLIFGFISNFFLIFRFIKVKMVRVDIQDFEVTEIIQSSDGTCTSTSKHLLCYLFLCIFSVVILVQGHHLISFLSIDLFLARTVFSSHFPRTFVFSSFHVLISLSCVACIVFCGNSPACVA